MIGVQPRNPRSSMVRAHKSPVATEIILEVEGIPDPLPSPETCYYRSCDKARQRRRLIYTLVAPQATRVRLAAELHNDDANPPNFAHLPGAFARSC